MLVLGGVAGLACGAVLLALTLWLASTRLPLLAAEDGAWLTGAVGGRAEIAAVLRRTTRVAS
jgi:hypothetical protein